MKYPESRLRRLRYNKNIRSLVQDVQLNISDLIYPIFVCEGENIKNEIESLKGQYRLSADKVIEKCDELIEIGIKSILLFGVSSKKDSNGEIACSSTSIVPSTIKKIKKKYKDEILIIADLCNCSYTNHGHCGTIKDGDVDNDKTLKTLCDQGLTLVKSGADVLAPSDMMDGRVSKIRESLDKNGFEKIPIFPYSVKYASSFYGPFRDAVDNNLEGGDRKTHQMDFKNSYEFIREVEYDINEGCDAVIIKPALAYLDVISKVKENFNIPIIAYSVSGEYAMVNSAAEKNLVDELELTMEIIYSIKRAGATAIVTYSAVEIAKKILSN
jgi:porphobilinogen synthase